MKYEYHSKGETIFLQGDENTDKAYLILKG